MTGKSNITVGPVEGGWSVVWDSMGEPMMFLSGGRAEAQARALARRLSEAGEDVEVAVRDRGRVLVGLARYPAVA
jgi:hypothetical protein